jgi:glucose-1-phosphate cytidylyltransferase
MKVVILAGGYGTRISEETNNKPKPLVEIGTKPIIWHIMKFYSCYGFNEFIICTGYKGYCFNEYFENYFSHNSDITYNIHDNTRIIHNSILENWKVTLVQTGLDTMTGGRLLRIRDYIKDDIFMLTYGDGLININLNLLLQSHITAGKIATITAVNPPARFGALNIKDNAVINFKEKPTGNESLINGGYFVFNKNIFSFLKDDSTILERSPLEEIASIGELNAFIHDGFWQPMDTLRDKNYLEESWIKDPQWKIW